MLRLDGPSVPGPSQQCVRPRQRVRVTGLQFANIFSSLSVTRRRMVLLSLSTGQFFRLTTLGRMHQLEHSWSICECLSCSHYSAVQPNWLQPLLASQHTCHSDTWPSTRNSRSSVEPSRSSLSSCTALQHKGRGDLLLLSTGTVTAHSASPYMKSHPGV